MGPWSWGPGAWPPPTVLRPQASPVLGRVFCGMDRQSPLCGPWGVNQLPHPQRQHTVAVSTRARLRREVWVPDGPRLPSQPRSVPALRSCPVTYTLWGSVFSSVL